MNSYKDLIVWQKSIQLVVKTYRYTELFPKTETYGLISQMRRAAVSIPSNIAEGRRRFGIRQYIRFLNIAYASGAELETQLEISNRLGYGNIQARQESQALLEEVMKMLNIMMIALSK
ncbi:MAG: four helix bundle protein [Candidatus Komeilibacteria bacterium]